jgi:translocation and assembly module TamA
MLRRPGKRLIWAALAVALAGLASLPAAALDRLDVVVRGSEDDLEATVNAASQLRSLEAQGQADPQDLIAAARSDYGRILAALYARGHYSVVVRILVDGREAASIPALEVPAAISVILIEVDPGPPFAFGQARIAPLAQGTVLPDGFRAGEPAESGRVTDAVAVSLRAWRDAGHAKVAVANESVVADHARQVLEVDVGLDPGPRLRFGPLAVEGQERMRERRIRKIAGLPEGESFSETELRRAETRLRRTGIFSSVSLVEDDQVTAPDLLGITAKVVEQKPRRYSFGAEIASIDGISLTGSWLHRNLLGGGERFRVEGGVTNIGSSESGVDYGFGITLDRPATLTPDTTAGLLLRFDHVDDVDDQSDTVEFGLAFSHIFSEQLTARAGLTYSYQRGTDPAGDYEFRNLAVPLGITWDRRDVATDARRGFYLDASVRPFLGFDTTGSGVQAVVDGRLYRSIGGNGRFVVALRAQGGAVYGPDILDTPRDLLFFSGGGGTVRGQPYRSLGVSVSRGLGPQFQIGGQFFAAGSLELRAMVTENIGVVGFIDAGSVGLDSAFGSLSNSHAGAGIGLRYKTGIGPIRLDVATPVSGDTGDGVQFYIGLGQAF